MLAECVEKITTWWRNPVVYDTALMVYTAMPPVIAPILFWIDAPYGTLWSPAVWYFHALRLVLLY